ncbi:MAG: nucleoid-associated protein [Bacteroidales bacterium]|jgi:hypothetical protein|nr:nucleoid-associated protein [Bacteroidales bacterium]
MIQIEETVIGKISLNRFSKEDKSIISNSLYDYTSEEEENILKRILLKPFVSHFQTFEFQHDLDINYNILFTLAKNIFEGTEFIEQSAKIAQHLISSSKHPNIKDGDVFIAKFEDIKMSNKYYEGLGIFKFEDKDSFIETSIENRKLDLKFRKGIGSKKPDKACLIMFTEEPFTILIIDSNINETDYWQKDFINHKPKKDNVNDTNNFLTLTKSFITNQVPNDFEVSKADQIDLLNRSVEYFKSNDTFEKKKFEEEVFKERDIIDSFRNFDDDYRRDNKVEFSDSFEISVQAVKKQARVFKSVLKLDKNFHIYIHGNKELIEQGVDENGRKFYKIYYEEEN